MSGRGFLPLPAVAARAGPFRVAARSVASGGACALPWRGADGVFLAPLDNLSLMAIAIRQHEYGHLALEGGGLIPARVLMLLCNRYRLDEGWVQAGLDVIVNGFMLASGAVEIAHLEPCSLPIPDTVSRSEAAMLALRSHMLSCAASLSAPLAEIGNFDATEQSLLRDVAVDLATFSTRRKRIPMREIAVRLGILQTVFGPNEQYPGTAGSSSTPDSDLDPVLKSQLISSTKAAAPKWGDMIVLRRPLTLAYSSARRKLRHRPAFAGAFRYPHRACLPAMDGRVFRSCTSGLGGTALVDCSGSMGLNTEGLQEILDALPAATVAVYAGLPGDARQGWLCVVARHGRMADLGSLASCIGSCNVVDAPALIWLKSQKPPRLWISDGLVNGIGGKVSAGLILDVVDLARSGRIKRYENVKSLAAGLSPLN
jgi:hypothetical protein